MTTPGTRKRSIRIPDPLWHEFQAACGVAGVNASVVIRGLVREWIKTNGDKQGEK